MVVEQNAMSKRAFSLIVRQPYLRYVYLFMKKQQGAAALIAELWKN